jgi:hyperosmotically inducible periplasmic protein
MPQVVGLRKEATMNRRFSIGIGTLLVAALSSWGCTSSGPQATEPARTATRVVDDAAITASVKIALAVERGVKATDINVDTDRGVVTLSGVVGSQAERRLAVKVTEDVNGVKEVVDGISVSG